MRVKLFSQFKAGFQPMPSLESSLVPPRPPHLFGTYTGWFFFFALLLSSDFAVIVNALLFLSLERRSLQNNTIQNPF